jgi:futalosine hydrolase
MSTRASPHPGRGVSLGSPTLVLVPTDLELASLVELGGLDGGLAIVRTCGFGPVAAAARTAGCIAELHPARVLLVGIAGTYDARVLALGQAVEFDSVALDGIAAGDRGASIGAESKRFAQWPGSGSLAPIHDRIALGAPRGGAPSRMLLSVCAASSSREQADARRRRFDGAIAEDMEAFGVALACALDGVPLRVVRGVSNLAGDGDHSRWQIARALESARELALGILRGAGATDGPP